jgi:hypothetical protein
VLHAMSIVGSSGTYGRRLRGAVIGFGATAGGAVTALNALGFIRPGSCISITTQTLLVARR